MSTPVRFATTETEAQPFVGDYSGSGVVVVVVFLGGRVVWPVVWLERQAVLSCNLNEHERQAVLWHNLNEH